MVRTWKMHGSMLPKAMLRVNLSMTSFTLIYIYPRRTIAGDISFNTIDINVALPQASNYTFH